MIRPFGPLVIALGLVGLVAVAGGLPGSTGTAHAAPPRVAQDDADLAKAKKLAAQGKKLFSLYRFEEALEKFEDAFAIQPNPNLLFNIGQCHRNLENYDQAIFSFRRYLKLKPNANRRDHIEDLIQELEELEEKAEQERQRKKLVPGPEPKPGNASTPVYKRWWFWTGVAAVAAGTTAVVLTTRGGGSGGLPSTDLGNLDFGR